MATMVSNRRSTFGINCVRCKDELIAPERSEYRHGTHIRHLWYCSNCETSFESLEFYSSRGHDGGRYLSIDGLRVDESGLCWIACVIS